jgi:hypothetical protein
MSLPALFTVLALLQGGATPSPREPGVGLHGFSRPTAVSSTNLGLSFAPGLEDDKLDLGPLEDFQRLVRRASGREGINALNVAEVRRQIGDLLVWETRAPQHTVDVDSALLDLLGACLDSEHPVRNFHEAHSAPNADNLRTRLRSAVARPLKARLDTQRARWIAREVLMIPRAHSRERRLAGAWLLAQEQHPEGLMSLIVLARGDDPGLAELATVGLSGWDHETAHDLFIELWQEPPVGFRNTALAACERHFSGIRFQAQSVTEAKLGEVVKLRLTSFVWQEASRAVALSNSLSNDYAVPLLIEALTVWIARGENGRQSLRIQFEIVKALETRSGRTIGLHVDRWRTWWSAVRNGQAPMVVLDDPDNPRTEARFFGLRPMSDRLAFLIDRSGSMKEPFDSDGRTSASEKWSRYDEAVQQMIEFLRTLGPACQFRVVVFSNGSDVWHKTLRPADERNLKSARGWLLGRPPDGGTNLRGGVERAIDLRKGAIDLERLGIDTVVVLCDGATDRGSAWVENLLEEVNGEARIVFHCVQIGNSGDGTLELLARLTDGDFVRRR